MLFGLDDAGQDSNVASEPREGHGLPSPASSSRQSACGWPQTAVNAILVRLRKPAQRSAIAIVAANRDDAAIRTREVNDESDERRRGRPE